MKDLKEILFEGLFDVDAEDDLSPETIVSGLLKKWTMENNLTYEQDQDIVIFTSEDRSTWIDIKDDALNKITEIYPNIKFVFKKFNRVIIKTDLTGVSIGIPENKYSSNFWDGRLEASDEIKLNNCAFNCPVFVLNSFYKNYSFSITNSSIVCDRFEFNHSEKQKLSSINLRGSKIQANVVVGDVHFISDVYPEAFKDKNWIKTGPLYIPRFDLWKIYPKIFECNNFIFEKINRKVTILMHNNGQEFIQLYEILKLDDKLKHIVWLSRGEKPVILEKPVWYGVGSPRTWLKVKES